MAEQLRYRRLWLAAGWGVVGAIVWLSLTPAPPSLGVNLWDKAQHYSAYLLLTGWFLQIYRSGAARLRVAAVSIALGAVLEVLQGLGGVRHFEFADMLANTLGAFTAVVVVGGRLADLLVSAERLATRDMNR